MPRTLNRQAGSRATYAFSPALRGRLAPLAVRRLTLARLQAIIERARAGGAEASGPVAAPYDQGGR